MTRTVLASTVVTVVVGTVPAVHVAYRALAWRVALGTASSLVAMLAAFLAFGRLRRLSGRNELLLTCALVLLGLSSVLVAVDGHGLHPVIDSEGRVCGVLGALLLALASGASRWRLERMRRPAFIALTGLLCVAVLGPLVAWLFGARLSGGAGVTVTATATSWPRLESPVGVLAMLATSALFFAVASAGFLQRAERRGDEFSAWLAVASVLAAFSRVNYLLFPSRYTDWIYTGDAFWLLSCGALLIGVMREITSYWRSVAQAAVLEERRRIARELHDGVAQELAYIGRNLCLLAPLAGERRERLLRLRRAVERAQLESRRALVALSAPAEEPLDVALARAVREVADRFEVDVDLDLASGVRLSPARAESLTRIACEAVANSARHSGAHRVALTLDRAGAAVRLRVRDSGCGFDTATQSSGFGLVSMCDRARAIDGRLRVDSAPGRGTTVEVAL